MSFIEKLQNVNAYRQHSDYQKKHNNADSNNAYDALSRDISINNSVSPATKEDGGLSLTINLSGEKLQQLSLPGSHNQLPMRDIVTDIIICGLKKKRGINSINISKQLY